MGRPAPAAFHAQFRGSTRVSVGAPASWGLPAAEDGFSEDLPERGQRLARCLGEASLCSFRQLSAGGRSRCPAHSGGGAPMSHPAVWPQTRPLSLHLPPQPPCPHTRNPPGCRVCPGGAPGMLPKGSHQSSEAEPQRGSQGGAAPEAMHSSPRAPRGLSK